MMTTVDRLGEVYTGSDTAESAALDTKEFVSAEAAATSFEPGEGGDDKGEESAGAAVSFLVSACCALCKAARALSRSF